MLQRWPPSPLCSNPATTQPCIAQLSGSKTLAQVRPEDADAVRLTLTAGVSEPRLVSWPSRCQLLPPSVLVRRVIREAAVWAAHSCPLALAVAKTGAVPVSTRVQRAPPSRLTRI